MFLDLIDEMQISSCLNEKDSVVLDFSADWCAPCRKFAVTFHEVSGLVEYKHIVFIRVDVDKFPSLSTDYNITSIPTMILLSSKKQSKKLVGYKEKEQFMFELNDYFWDKPKTKPADKKPANAVQPEVKSQEQALSDVQEEVTKQEEINTSEEVKVQDSEENAQTDVHNSVEEVQNSTEDTSSSEE